MQAQIVEFLTLFTNEQTDRNMNACNNRQMQIGLVMLQENVWKNGMVKNTLEEMRKNMAHLIKTVLYYKFSFSNLKYFRMLTANYISALLTLFMGSK